MHLGICNKQKIVCFPNKVFEKVHTFTAIYLYSFFKTMGMVTKQPHISLVLSHLLCIYTSWDFSTSVMATPKCHFSLRVIQAR